MCEQCKTSRISGEEIPQEEGPIPCETPTGEDGTDCSRDARYLVSDYSADDHLCEEHMTEKSRQLEEGLGDFLREAGLQKAGDFAPIKEPATCDHVSPEDMLRVPCVSPCGKPAPYVELTLTQLALCTEHAAEWGYRPEGS